MSKDLTKTETRKMTLYHASMKYFVFFEYFKVK